MNDLDSNDDASKAAVAQRIGEIVSVQSMLFQKLIDTCLFALLTDNRIAMTSAITGVSTIWGQIRGINDRLQELGWFNVQSLADHMATMVKTIKQTMGDVIATNGVSLVTHQLEIGFAQQKDVIFFVI